MKFVSVKGLIELMSVEGLMKFVSVEGLINFCVIYPLKIAKGGVPYETDNRKWQHQARQSSPLKCFGGCSFQGVLVLSFVFAHFGD